MTIEELTSYFQEQIDSGKTVNFDYELKTDGEDALNGIVPLTHHNTLLSFLPLCENWEYIGVFNTKPRFKVKLKFEGPRFQQACQVSF